MGDGDILKKLKFIIPFLLMCLIWGLGISNVNATGISIYINGDKQSFSNQAVIEKGTTLVPLRGIFESLGANVQWNQSTQTIDASKGNTKIWLKIGSENAKVNGNAVTLSVPAQVKSGKTLVPLRFISEYLGANVQWDQKNSKVSITGNTDNEEISNPQLPEIEEKEVPILNIGETYSDEKIEVTIKEVEYVQVGENDGFKVYLTITNKSDKPLENTGGLQFKLNNPQYEKELNNLGYSSHFDSNGYIYKGETRDGYYQWYFERDVEIKEIDFYIKESGILKESKAKWINVLNEVKNPTEELLQFLNKNFSELDTSIGKTKFTFDILENDSIYNLFDYWIQVEYEYEFFGGAMNSIKYTREQKETLINQLREHQRNLAEAIIKEMPDKKFYGGYYDSWYRYPTLRVDLQTRRYFSWTNYDNSDFFAKYHDIKPSTFRWYDFIDDSLEY